MSVTKLAPTSARLGELQRRRAGTAGRLEDGAALLDEVERYLARFVVYPSEHARVAHTLWVAHTHLMQQWESTPRLAFLSPEPASGKSRALEVTEPLVPRPVHAVNTTPAYLFRKVGDEAGPPTLLYDEVDTVFGPRAKDNEDIRGMLNAGHRRGAMAGRCVVRGHTVTTEELPAYCAVALAGLGDLPDTILSRAIVVRMQRRAPTEQVEPFRHRVNGPEGAELGRRLADWATGVADQVRDAWPKLPDGIEDRAADVWEPLLAVADAAGSVADVAASAADVAASGWPTRSRVAAVALVADLSGRGESLGIRLLGGLQKVFNESGAEALATETIIEKLCALEEEPWSDLRGRPLDSRGLANRLRNYMVRPRSIRVQREKDHAVVRGYRREDLVDVWARYLPDDDLPPQRHKSATSATSATEVSADDRDVRQQPALVPEPSGAGLDEACPHGMPGGQLPDMWLKGHAACPQCRLVASNGHRP